MVGRVEAPPHLGKDFARKGQDVVNLRVAPKWAPVESDTTTTTQP